MQQTVMNNAENFATPFMIVQGGKDKLVDHKHIRNFYEKSSIKDKNLLLYEGSQNILE